MNSSSNYSLRLIPIRLVQFFAYLLKAFFYLHFWLLPSSRFVLPAKAEPLWKSTKPKRISRILWQTNFTDRVTFPVYVNYLWNRMMAPTFEYRFCNDDICSAYINENFPGPIADAYASLLVGAARADFWRVLVLLQEGGIYIDIDAALVWPLELLIDNDQSELLIQNGPLTNFFMASAPGNPLMREIAEAILRNIQENTVRSVLAMTGPKAVDAVADREGVVIKASRLVCKQGHFTSKLFQYVDKPRGQWGMEQKDKGIVG